MCTAALTLNAQEKHKIHSGTSLIRTTHVKTKLSFVKANVLSREDARDILFNVNTKLQNVKNKQQQLCLSNQVMKHNISANPIMKVRVNILRRHILI